MTSSSSGGSGAACPELPHEGHLHLCSGGPGQQWLAHSKTGEKQWLPSRAPEEWSLHFSAGMGYIVCGSESMWCSGNKPLLKKSLHADPHGKLY
eukprot:1279279-Lingulodinium_polyedra.AAC.1